MCTTIQDSRSHAGSAPGPRRSRVEAASRRRSHPSRGGAIRHNREGSSPSTPSVPRRTGLADIGAVTEFVRAVRAHSHGLHPVRREDPDVLLRHERFTVLASGHTPSNSVGGQRPCVIRPPAFSRTGTVGRPRSPGGRYRQNPSTAGPTPPSLPRNRSGQCCWCVVRPAIRLPRATGERPVSHTFRSASRTWLRPYCVT